MTAPRTPFIVRIALLAVLAVSSSHGLAVADTFEPNDSVAQAAGPLQSGVSVASFIGNAFDIDYYFLDAGIGPFTVTLTSLPAGTDYELFIVDEFDNVLLSSENQGTTDEIIQANVTGAGRFFIVVGPFSGFSDSDSYLLTATFVPIVTNNAPTVTVLAPNGGESIPAGSTFNVTWTASDVEDGTTLAIDIEYSANGGASFSSVATGIANSGAFAWSVPAAPTTQGRIRITARDSGALSGNDQSNANFTVAAAPPLGNATITLGSATVNTGAVANIPVTLTHDQTMAAMQLTVLFDAARLTPQSVTKGARAGSLTLTSNLTRPGEVRFTLTSDAGATVAAGSGTVATIAFLALPGASTTVALTPAEATVADPQARGMTLTTDAGSVTVNGVAPELTLAAPGGVVGTPGGFVDVPITFTSNLPVAALQFALVFNPVVLLPISVTQGSGTTGMTLETNTSINGQVRAVFYRPSGGTLAPGSGTACTIRFQVRSDAPGGTTLTFADVVASDGEGNGLAVTPVAGSVTEVRIARLAASAAEDGVHITWSAEADAGHLGFRVLRGEHGEESLHRGLLPADAREFVDATATPDRAHAYWLEALDRNGLVQRFGPVRVEAAAVTPWAGVPYPNPTRGTSTIVVRGLGGGDDVVVVDASGSRIRRLSVPAGGAGTVTWDGRTETGEDAPAGIYFVRAGRGGRAATRTIVRLGP